MKESAAINYSQTEPASATGAPKAQPDVKAQLEICAGNIEGLFKGLDVLRSRLAPVSRELEKANKPCCIPPTISPLGHAISDLGRGVNVARAEVEGMIEALEI